MANFFPVSQMVEYNLQLNYANSLATIVRATKDDFFNNNAMNGVTKTIPYPLQYKSIQGRLTYDPTTDIQSSVKRTTTMTLNLMQVLPIQMDGMEMSFQIGTSNIDQFFTIYVNKMIVSMGNTLSRQVMDSIVMNFTDTTGDPTQPLNGVNTMTAIQAQFANMGLSQGGSAKYFGTSPTAAASLQVPYSTYYNPDVNRPILKGDTNKKGDLGGVEHYMDNTIVTHQNGTFAASGNITLSGTVASASINDPYSSLAFAGFTNNAVGVLNVGDRITFESAATPSDKVYAVNPQMPLIASGVGNYAPYGTLGKTFVVISDGSGNSAINASGSGTATARVFPPIVSTATDPYQNVSRQPVSGDKVLLFGGGSQRYVMNIAWVSEGLIVANPIPGTSPAGATGNDMSLGGLVYQKPYHEKVEGTDLNIGYLLSAAGSDPSFLTTITGRTLGGCRPYQGYGFVVASSI